VRRAEATIRRNQAAYLAEAQQLSLTGSFGWNTSSEELFWSDETFRVFGHDPAKRPSIETMMKRVHPDDTALVQLAMDRAVKEKQNFDIEHRLLMPDGAVKYLHVVAHAATDDPNRAMFIGAIMDITAAKRAQAQLDQAQSELAHVTRVISLGALTASIAHEVNQPLAAIVTNGEACLRWLDHSTPRLDEVRSSVQRMISDGTRAGDVVQRIRAHARKGAPQMAGLNMNNVVNDVVSLVQREATNHHIVVQVELASNMPRVLGDQVQLQQVIMNLMINGIQAMAGVENRPRELIVRSGEDRPGEAFISVQDSGVGIDPENASRLFDPFFTTKPTGMGMGLSICRSIVDAHGGRLWASPIDGGGTMFKFTLPVQAGAAA
jgi:PAS domain S-box-containing protein